jgi:uroporphyrinogen decarboxylase
MTKRDAVLAVGERRAPEFTPAAFFMHFEPSCHEGRAAVAKHIEFFRFTGMDLAKIQYERKFPSDAAVVTPADWARVKPLTRSFFEPLLEAVDGIVQALGPEAVVIVTLYSPFMCAGHVGGPERLAAHMAEDAAAVRTGMEIVTDSLMTFVDACIELGVDGFYHSTQGYETGRLAHRDLFHKCVKPYDLRVMRAIESRCRFSVLHVCDYHSPYDDISPFVEYPGTVVNCSPLVGERRLSGAEIAAMFGRPFMGGIERKGAIATGSEDDARRAAREALAGAPTPTILAADCTIPPGSPWVNLRAAIEEAHAWSPLGGR